MESDVEQGVSADAVSLHSMQSSNWASEINEAVAASVLQLLDSPEQLEALSTEERQRVLDLAHSIISRPPRTDEQVVSTDDESYSTDTDPEQDVDPEEMTQEVNLVLTMRLLHNEMGDAMLNDVPRSTLYEIIRCIASVASRSRPDAAHLSVRVIELLQCSSAGNILQRLTAWPEGHQQLRRCTGSTEFHALFSAALHELQKRAADSQDQRNLQASDGQYTLGQCDICCGESDDLLWRGGCCQASVCVSCLHRWLSDHLTEVNAKLGCPGCSAVLTVSQLHHLLSESDMERREQLLARRRGANSHERDCPRCSCMAQRPRGQRRFRSGRSQKELGGVTVKCAQCDYVWCFDCHSPAHPGLSCRRFQSGVHLLEDWAKQMENSGLRKARRCPKCRAMIEKNDGCNHMTCGHCQHEFCYLCSKRWRVRQLRVPFVRWSVFGSHSDRLSVFGCRQIYKPNNPDLRRFVRGTLFVLRTAGLILSSAVVGALAVALLGLSIPLSPVLIPVIIVLARRGSLNCLVRYW